MVHIEIAGVQIPGCLAAEFPSDVCKSGNGRNLVRPVPLGDREGVFGRHVQRSLWRSV